MRAIYRTLRPIDFPVCVDVPARFSDLDTLRHVNNVAVAGIFAEGRNALIRKIFESIARPKGLQFIVGQVGISYLGEAHYPATFEIASGILKVGGSSLRVGQAFFYNGECTSIAETILVARSLQRSQVLPDCVREAVAALTLPADRFPPLLLDERRRPTD